MTAASAAPAGAVARAGLAARLDDLERQRSADVEQRLLGAREVEDEARAAGLEVEAMRARLVVADMLLRLGDSTRAAQLAVEVNAWAAQEGPRSVRSRSHLVLSSLLESIGDAASSLDHAVRALELLDGSTPARQRGSTLLRLADAAALVGAVDDARRRYREAGAVFAALRDEDHRLIVLNNLAVLEYESGDATAALAAADQLVQRCGEDALDAAYADTIARAHLAAGDLGTAERMVLLGFRRRQTLGEAQAVTPAELLLTHAEVLLALGRVDEAAQRLDECTVVCEERGLRAARVQTLELLARVHAARGDLAAAYATHRTFHEEYVAVRSHQQEAAARTRQALAETAEARAEARRFREQARTDPLTELPNRRFVDEELPRLLAEAAHEPGCVLAAVVDVDHFKQVNDGFSHDVGDEVLRRLGQRLAAAAVPHGFAARLGGEEFLVVLRCDEPGTGAARLERLRTDVQALPWQEVAAGLGVTVSIGAGLAGPADTQATLLRRADENLYRAKAQGRNRVVGDPGAAQRAT
ncbi:diguanylate cyclase [Kineosporia sp. A_224]|uniref:GGDEF domain-containing protein n=1 Tax=Kineosporia sp. A_224 TaxID=1962180 RepID=UPI000B4AE7EC|nr:GGDEF domain-containing protein [Kineosporia sp. A_224]